MDDDELPPWLGERFRDAFHEMFRNQHDAELDASADQEPTP